jgi:hypothetical protein
MNPKFFDNFLLEQSEFNDTLFGQLNVTLPAPHNPEELWYATALYQTQSLECLPFYSISTAHHKTSFSLLTSQYVLVNDWESFVRLKSDLRSVKLQTFSKNLQTRLSYALLTSTGRQLCSWHHNRCIFSLANWK